MGSASKNVAMMAAINSPSTVHPGRPAIGDEHHLPVPTPRARCGECSCRISIPELGHRHVTKGSMATGQRLKLAV